MGEPARKIGFGYPATAGLQWSPPEEFQQKVLDSKKAIQILEWGRGCGKSTTIMLRGLRNAIKYPGLPSLVIAPSYKVLKQGMIRILKTWQRICKKQWGWDPIKSFTVSTQEVRCTLWQESYFEFRSTKDMDDLRGGEYGQLLVDEADYIPCSDRDWAAFIPVLRGYGPMEILVAGTPSVLGTGMLTMLKQLQVDKHNVNISNAKTTDMPYFPASTLELMAATLSEEDWAREVEGRAVARSGLVYPEFSTLEYPDGHIREWDRVAELSRRDLQRWRTFICIDWGPTLSHFLFLAARQLDDHKVPEVVVYRDEPCSRTNAEEIAAKCRALAIQDPIRPTAVIVDPEGTVDIAIARPLFSSFGIPMVYERNPNFRKLQSTVQLVRRGLGTKDGSRTFAVAKSVYAQGNNKPGGRGIVASFQAYSLEEVRGQSGLYGNKPFDDNKTTHSLDCLRYFYINMYKFGFKWPFGYKEWSENRIHDYWDRQKGGGK